MWSGLCSSTPRGDGNGNVSVTVDGKEVLKVYAAQPREGTETGAFDKLSDPLDKFEVYAAQPREGTETMRWMLRIHRRSIPRFMQLNPARGRKPDEIVSRKGDHFTLVYAAQPREGTETVYRLP